MIIGSHVKMSAPDYMAGSVKEALSLGENAFMIYTGAPQNTQRKPISQLKVEEALELMKQNNIDPSHVIIHAPYIINLANTIKLDTFEIGVRVLKDEMKRCDAIHSKILVLHPGSHVKAGEDVGLNQIVKGLDMVLEEDSNVFIALETMAGKGSELGYTFEQLRYIIDHVKDNARLRICMDTCHIHDAGYDITNFDDVLDEFDRVIGLDRLVCIHVNDSKNIKGARKDRHSNIGFGEIGFETLCKIVHHPKLESVVKILETPFVNGNPPYALEINMLKNKVFDEHILESL